LVQALSASGKRAVNRGAENRKKVMRPITRKQQIVLNAIQREGIAGALTLIKLLDMSEKAVKAHIQRLERDGHIRIVSWEIGKNGVAMKIYAVGAGEHVKLDKPALRQKMKLEEQRKRDAERKAKSLRNTFDPYAKLATNGGWVSTIHSLDYAIQHGDHIRCMARFQPRPDVAAAWMFNEPNVELLGARYD